MEFSGKDAMHTSGHMDTFTTKGLTTPSIHPFAVFCQSTEGSSYIIAKKCLNTSGNKIYRSNGFFETFCFFFARFLLLSLVVRAGKTSAYLPNRLYAIK
jgi:hypothetical protein